MKINHSFKLNTKFLIKTRGYFVSVGTYFDLIHLESFFCRRRKRPLAGQNIKVFQLFPKAMKHLAWFVFAVLYIQKLAHVLRPILTNQSKGVSGQSDSKPQPTWMSPLVLCRAFTWFYFLICDWCMKSSCNVLLLQRNTEQVRWWLEHAGNSVFSYTRPWQ